MTVVLLDPHRPDMIPIRARGFLAGTVYVTEDVPTAVLWELDHFEPVFAESSVEATLLSTDPDHPLVAARIAAGDTVIAPSIPAGSDLLDAVALMDRLRRGGPWESQQTHASLRRYLLEECYELLDAIAAGGQDDLREELGDLLLQVLFHARIAADHPTEPFDIDAVARAFTAKVSGRTPGVLSGAHNDLETQIREWEERKAAEKNRGSVLDGIATGQPALALTQKVLERLAAAGYPIDRIDPAILSVTVTVGDDSAEDQARQRTLDLMAQVHATEEQAAIDGIVLDGPAAWAAVLDGVANPIAGAEQGAPESGVDDAGAVDAEVLDAEVVETGVIEPGAIENGGFEAGALETPVEGDIAETIVDVTAVEPSPEVPGSQH